jgi:hypothetical protein
MDNSSLIKELYHLMKQASEPGTMNTECEHNLNFRPYWKLLEWLPFILIKVCLHGLVISWPVKQSYFSPNKWSFDSSGSETFVPEPKLSNSSYKKNRKNPLLTTTGTVRVIFHEQFSLFLFAGWFSQLRCLYFSSGRRSFQNSSEEGSLLLLLFHVLLDNQR